MNDAKEADSAALRPLALKLAKVYKPCAQVVKKTELMEGVADTHGIRPRREEDIVDWLVRVLYKLEYYDHGILTYMLGSLPCSRNMSDPMWDGTTSMLVWMNGCGPKQNLGGIKPIAP